MKMNNLLRSRTKPKTHRTLRGKVFAAIGSVAFLSIILFMLLVMAATSSVIKHIGWGFSYMASDMVARDLSSPDTLSRLGVNSIEELDFYNPQVQRWLKGLTGTSGKREVPPFFVHNSLPDGFSDHTQPTLDMIQNQADDLTLTDLRNTKQIESYLVDIFRENFVCFTIKLDNKIVYQSGGEEQLKASQNASAISKLPHDQRSLLQQMQLWYYKYFDTSVTTAITDMQQNQVGSVTATLNHATVNLLVVALLLLMAGIGLLVGCIALLVSIVFSRRVLKPLTDLQQQMNSMAEGELQEVMNNPIVLKRPFREVENLVDARNRLVMRFKENTELLHEQKDELAEMAEDLKIKNNGLQAEIKERERIEAALLEAKEAAVYANKAKSEFLANMSHEIRTPLNAVLGFTELLKDSVTGDKEQRFLNNIQLSGKTLMRIINDILDFSKIEAGKLEMEQVSFKFDEVLQQLADIMAARAAEKGLELLFDIPADLPVELVGDPLRLGQILINLVGNAIKFSDQGEIIVAVQRVYEDDSELKLKLAVKDCGIGLSQEQQSKLFQAFSQADSSTTREYGGTGLGLAISKQIAHLMGGEIGLESQLGEGSIFWFTAVFAKPAHPVKDYASCAAVLAGLKVLVVDDSPVSREIAVSMLDSFRFEAVAAASGREALDVFRTARDNKPFDLVILNYLLPDMEGCELVTALADPGSGKKVPRTLILKTYEQLGIVNSTTEAAGDACLIKPVSPSVLLDTILQLMDQEALIKKGFAEKGSSLNKTGLLAGVRILLVEDNEINQELAINILEKEGIKVSLAGNGREALDMLEEEDFDGVLMDCQMPVMDGYQAAAAIRTNPRWQDLPVIAMTANALYGEREKAIAAGMNDHVPKPVDAGELLKALIRWTAPQQDNQTGREYTSGSSPVVFNSAGLDLNKSGLQHLQGVNIQQGLEIAQDNIELYCRLLSRFKLSYQDFAEDFYSARQDSLISATRLAHTLKGTAGNLGIESVMEAAASLENACSEELDDKGIEQFLEAVNMALQPVLDSLENLSGIPEGQPVKPQLDEAAVLALLSELKKFLAEDDSQSVKLYQDIMNQIKGTQYEKILSILDKPIHGYDLNTAAEMLEELFPDI